VTLESGTSLGSLGLGAGDDTLTIDSATTTGPLNGAEGNDTLIVTGTADKSLSMASNFEVVDLRAAGNQQITIGSGMASALSVKAGTGDTVKLGGAIYAESSAAGVDAVGDYFYDTGANTLTYFAGGVKTITFDIAGSCSLPSNNVVTWTGGSAAVRTMGVLDLPDAVDLPGA
jgi:hypothetical protein